MRFLLLERLLSVAALGLAAAVAMTSCGDGTSKPNSQSRTEIQTPRPEAEADTPARLTLLGWGEFIPETVLQKFTDQTGIEIDYLSYDNTDDLKGRISSEPDRYDVVLTDEDTAARLRDRRQAADLDHQQLPNLVNLGGGSSIPLPDSTNAFSTPYLLGKTILVYNPELVRNIPARWSSLWDREVIGDGQVWLVDEPLEVFGIANLVLGNPMNSADPAELEAARNLLLKQLEQVDVVYASDVEIEDALADGRCVAAVLYDSNAAAAQRKNESLRTAVPAEGIPLCCDVFLISRESGRSAAAHAFLNFMLGAEVAAECAEWNRCATPNAAAKPLMKPGSPNGAAARWAELPENSAFQDSRDPERSRLIGRHMGVVKARLNELRSTPKKER